MISDKPMCGGSGIIPLPGQTRVVRGARVGTFETCTGCPECSRLTPLGHISALDIRRHTMPAAQEDETKP